VWNQLDVFGFGKEFVGLRDDTLTEDDKKQIAAQFLVRRVTAMRVGEEELTKNQYRREWRHGGVHQYDDPIRVDDDRQRLIVALVQKKVAELLGSETFNMSFQIGMLASFESFLETTRLKRAEEEPNGNFDDADQTDDLQDQVIRNVIREGMDVRDVNRLGRYYREHFGREMPHPKMDALVDSLNSTWTRGQKALIFVRRVKSVDELKRKLDEKYDVWLIQVLRDRLPKEVLVRFETIVEKYMQEKRLAETARQVRATAIQARESLDANLDTDDRGGTDTFFAWFFRGEGPKGVVSGANIQRRFIQKGTAYSTFFEDNYIGHLLEARPGNVTDALVKTLDRDEKSLRQELGRRAMKYLGRAKKVQKADRFEAAQGAAIELLMERRDPLGDRARIIWHERFETSVRNPSANEALDIADALEQTTFYTELRRPDRAELRKAIWPEPRVGSALERFREEQQRAQLLATAARLGHALIDLYVLTIQRLLSIEQRTLEDEGADENVGDRRRVDQYLDFLEAQRVTPVGERPWGAFDELAQIGQNFELILDVNAPGARSMQLAETTRYFGSILREQQPIGGMSGQINKTLVQQFRMPGYPFILISTDLLQEGEDLHTFCSAVHHYGIAWTPSSMEQRVGRIDRVRSQTDRRLSGLDATPAGDDLLQVYYPHLEDTVEALQVHRVLECMNTFLRLMHEGLAVPKGDHRRVDVSREMISGGRTIEPIRERLRTAFPIQQWALQGANRSIVCDETKAAAIGDRFQKLAGAEYPGLAIQWEPPSRTGALLGTVKLATGRIQPFALVLKSKGEWLLIRCVSPVGLVDPEAMMAALEESSRARCVRIGAIIGRDEGSYDLTVEEDVLLAEPEHDVSRVTLLLQRVVEQADALEQIHLPSLDQTLDVFEADLKNEGMLGHV
jgi:hypothetical protein